MTSETLWKVSADIGRGWPDCIGRERKVRRFATQRGAAEWVATILALPSHHRLVAIEYGTIDYVDGDTGDFERLPHVACGACGYDCGPPDEPHYPKVCPACGSRARCLDRARSDE